MQPFEGDLRVIYYENIFIWDYITKSNIFVKDTQIITILKIYYNNKLFSNNISNLTTALILIDSKICNVSLKEIQLKTRSIY